MTNHQYFFILGRNPTLSIAEIVSRIDNRIKPNFSRMSDEFLILETGEEIDCQKLQEKLGGTIKIGKVMPMQIQINANFDANVIRGICDQLVKISEKSKKIYFGFSVYGGRLDIKKLALGIKKQLKEKGVPSRWVVSKEKNLSSVIVQKNKLLTDGAEFCFLTTQIDTDQNTDKRRSIRVNPCGNFPKSVYIGVTLGCQQFEEYSQRDFGRPARKIEEGMLPPKLAKIMINLAQTPENGVILDPFCGSGTILQEATLMGYQNIIGTDVDRQAINSTKENLKWLAGNYSRREVGIPTSLSKSKDGASGQLPMTNYQLFQTDVKEISKKLPANSVDAIITEPYLGPIKISKIKNQISKIISELSNLYLEAFQEVKKILKPNGKIVIIFPVFSARGGSAFGGKLNDKLHFLPILDDLKKSGWQIINPIPPELRKNPTIKITARNSILYSRPDQTVLREIFIFRLLNY